jgi:cytoskeletal protein CcmA (bactofilin family)
VISEHGRVDGEIHASHLVVNGLINGAISVTELLELQPKARVNGNVLYRALEMHKGAIVRGILTDESEDNRPLLKLASNQN